MAIWAAGVGLAIVLGILSGLGHSWTALLAAAAVLAVGGFYVRALGPEAGVILLLILTNVTDHFTFRVGPLGIRPEQVGLAVAVVVLAATRMRDLSLFRPRAAEWILLAWLALGLLSTLIASPDRGLSLKVLTLIAICTAAFALPRRLLTGPKAAQQFEVIVRWLLIAFATEAGWGSFAYLLHVFGPTISIGPNPASGHLEAYGTLWEQNVFGAFAAAGAVAWVYLGPNRFKRPWIGLAMCMTGLVVSLTRSAWLAALLVGVMGLSFRNLRRQIDLLMVGTGLLGGLLTAAAVLVVDAVGVYVVPVPTPVGGPVPHNGIFGAVGNLTDFFGRINQVSPVWGDISGPYVLIGRGIASFQALHVFRGMPQHIASLPLLVLNDTGVIGVFLFGSFVVAVFIRAWSRRHDPVVVGLSQMAIVIALANLATQTTELMVGWLLVGILMAATDIAPAAVRGVERQPTTRAA